MMITTKPYQCKCGGSIHHYINDYEYFGFECDKCSRKNSIHPYKCECGGNIVCITYKCIVQNQLRCSTCAYKSKIYNFQENK